MADPDILHELRLLADLSENVHRLQAVHEGLQSSLCESLQDAEPTELAVLEAALQLDQCNDLLRKKLALECERKRSHMIRNHQFKHKPSVIIQLENSFRLDWYSCFNADTEHTESVTYSSLGSALQKILEKWGFDHTVEEHLTEASQPLSDECETGERIEDLDCSYAENTRSMCASLRSFSMQYGSFKGSLKDQGSLQELALRDKPRDYGFQLEYVSYRFDQEPESSIIMQPITPGSGNESIKSGSLNKLVERLTDDQTQDLNLRFVFLLTYRSFTTATKFLDLLVERYRIPPPPNLTPNELVFFRNHKQKGIRLKIFSVIKKWVEDHYADFEQNEELKLRLKKLLRSTFADEPWSRKLSTTILNVIQKQESGSSRSTPLDLEHNVPSPEFRSFASADEVESRFTNISPLEIARQLCISDFEIFRRIEPRECLNQAWSKPNRNSLAPNIMRMIQRFNHVSQWSQWIVLNAQTRSQRQLCLRQMIKIGERCLSLNNFTSACAIYAGLESNSVYRLRNIWESLSSKIAKLYEALQATFKSDSKTKQYFRTLLQEAIPPCIPHLGLFLSDLTFIEDGNPNELHGLINFSKRRKLSERIMWIKQYQQVGYQLSRLPVVQDYLDRSLIPRNNDELYNLSKQIQS